jgi:hypothetical protein
MPIARRFFLLVLRATSTYTLPVPKRRVPATIKSPKLHITPPDDVLPGSGSCQLNSIAKKGIIRISPVTIAIRRKT